MAVQGHKGRDCVTVYDADKGAFREVARAELRRQLAALGFSDAQIDERLAALKPAEEE